MVVLLWESVLIRGTTLQCSTTRNLICLKGSSAGGGCGDDPTDGGGGGGGFPLFLPKEVHNIRDPFARALALRIQRLPVKIGFSESYIMSSCVKPQKLSNTSPVVLLHGFDSSCLEWGRSYPFLEEAGLEAWAVDVLGWGFSDLGLFPDLITAGSRRVMDTLDKSSKLVNHLSNLLPPCNAASKRYHLYQFWKSYIKRPMILVGPSMGAAVVIDFAFSFPEAVEKLVLIDASVYAEGTGFLAKLPRRMAYAPVSWLKSFLLRFYIKLLAFDDISLATCLDWTNVGRLHCLLPWWEDATINFILSGGYNVTGQIKQVKQKALIIWGEQDRIISKKFAVRLQCELPNAILRQIPGCGHLPHVEKPQYVAKLISDFAQSDYC